MSNHFQFLELAVNGVVKSFLEEKFGNWYPNEVKKQLNAVAEAYSIEVKCQLTVVEPIHAMWLIP